MVKVWAEKEFRNLRRLGLAGIPCPTVLLLKNHVLVMTLIGDHEKSRAAPRLKDFEIKSAQGIHFFNLIISCRVTIPPALAPIMEAISPMSSCPR
jgi:serine/threonine-protein kinase RIO1